MGIIDPAKRHYRDLTPANSDEHPIDQIIDSLPEIVDVDGAARRLSTHLQDPASRGDQEVWMQYEDRLYEQRILHSERAFDVGYEYGRFAGLAESLADAQWPVVDALSRAFQDVAIASPASPKLTLAALLTVARALVLASVGSSRPEVGGDQRA